MDERTDGRRTSSGAFGALVTDRVQELLDADSDALLEALETLGHLSAVGDALRTDTGTALFGPDVADDAWSGAAGDHARRLRLAETRYRVLIEQIPVVTFLASLAETGDQEIYVSPQIESLLGFTQEEWVSNPVLWFRQVHPDDRDKLSSDFAVMCISGEPFRGVVRVYTRDGVLRWVHMEARFVCDERGEPLFLQGAGFDVTDQYEAQAARERLLQEQAARREAEREQQRLLQVFQNLPGAITVLRGPDHVVEFANPVALELAGGEQVVGRPWAAAFPQFGLQVLTALGAVQLTGERAFLAEQPFRGRRSPERFFNFVCQPLPGYGPDGPLLTHAVEVTREVLARREVEQAVRLRDEALTQLTNAVKTREQFLSAAAHDLKTPVATTRGWAQLLQRRAAVEQQDAGWLAEGLKSIETSAARMAQMVEEFLDFARLQSGVALTLERRPADLVQLVAETVADIQEQTDRHELNFEAREPALVGDWDAARLRRVIGNLLDNAVKYSPEGGPVDVRVGRDPERPGFALLEVQDRGVGIPAGDLPHVFEQFHRGANVVGRISGTGIGLNGSWHIVRLHGGTIDVASTEGAGSTFAVRLPLQEG